MQAEKILSAARQKKQAALSEYESKLLLAEYGIPVTHEGLARSKDEAMALAREIGFPLAVKACSPELMHKSEGGWIELNIKNEAELTQAFENIISKAGDAIDGVLIQEMVSGQRELVAGLNRDPQFGPCVMLGLGGVMTEVLKDTAFRMAPIDKIEARDMADQLRCRSMLDEFRGQAPADMGAVCRTLEAIGQIGLEHEAVAEIDVNPLIIGKDGRVVAVDALVVLDG